MLTDGELDQSSTELAQLKIAHTKHQESLSEVLSKYQTLVEDYRRLKSDYEEERDSRERYKQLARGQERNPFVLVLVDGDGYIFDDDLVSNGAEGGQKAAQLLDGAIKRSLRDKGLENCRVMVRIYANLVGLSKVLSRAKLAGPEKRSLAPFTANFTRSNDLFDFVDAGELKENADFKIRSLFHLFVENAQCKHIYFAGCHDVGYINELLPYAASRDRITLVRHPAFHTEFSKLGMRIEDFANVFRRTPLDGQHFTASKAVPPFSPYKPASLPVQQSAPTPWNAQQEPSMAGGNQTPICKFYQKGNCRYGDNCHNQHINVTSNGPKSTFSDLNKMEQWRENAGAQPTPFQMSNLAKNDNDFMSEHQPAANNIEVTTNTSDPVQNQIDFNTTLPKSILTNRVPVNANNHRLDPFNPPVSTGDFDAFNKRIAKQKLCNAFHIYGYCPKSGECSFDHSYAPPVVVNALKQLVFTTPCPRNGACRRANCTYGHICQKANCKLRSAGNGYCKFSPYVHAQDLQLAGYMEADAYKGSGENGTNGARDESVSATASARGSTPRAESEGDDGALLDVRDDASLD